MFYREEMLENPFKKMDSKQNNFFYRYIANLQALGYTGPFNPKTLEDFWSIVWQNDSSKIVMLTNLYEGDKVNDGEKIRSKEENIIYYIQEEFYSIIKIILILFFEMNKKLASIQIKKKTMTRNSAESMEICIY